MGQRQGPLRGYSSATPVKEGAHRWRLTTLVSRLMCTLLEGEAKEDVQSVPLSPLASPNCRGGLLQPEGLFPHLPWGGKTGKGYFSPKAFSPTSPVGVVIEAIIPPGAPGPQFPSAESAGRRL